ncbi:MAG: hypothetical protein HP024_02725, partial [Acholeplasmatales bacterium]|nr:hypothetical protein [Acholeplasmatales bacterium]
MILLGGLLLGALSASYIYYFYNPKNICYQMTIRTNEQISLSQDYLIMIKNKLEEERINGQ